MLKPSKGHVLIRKVVEEEVVTNSGIITELRTEKSRINPYLIKANVEATNLDSDTVKVGDMVLAQFVALRPIEENLYVIDAKYIEAVIDPNANIVV